MAFDLVTSMTIDEAIRVLRDVELFQTGIKGKVDACEMAISALHVQQDADKNDLMSAEELDVCRKSNVPIWAVATCTTGKPSGWGLAGTRSALSQDFCNTVLWYETYGMEWIAYRRPPGENHA